MDIIIIALFKDAKTFYHYSLPFPFLGSSVNNLFFDQKFYLTINIYYWWAWLISLWAWLVLFRYRIVLHCSKSPRCLPRRTKELRRWPRRSSYYWRAPDTSPWPLLLFSTGTLSLSPLYHFVSDHVIMCMSLHFVYYFTFHHLNMI